MTAQRLGRKMVHMKNSSKKNISKKRRGGKINIYFCLIIVAKHILMLFERVIYSAHYSVSKLFTYAREQGGYLGPLLLSSFDKPIRSNSKYYVIY